MKRVDLTNYTVGDGVPYLVIDSLVALLFNPDMRLSALQLRTHNKVADKIEAGKEDGYVDLEESEFEVLKVSVETYQGYVRNDMQLVDRITGL
jgi:hypothetical protein